LLKRYFKNIFTVVVRKENLVILALPLFAMLIPLLVVIFLHFGNISGNRYCHWSFSYYSRSFIVNRAKNGWALKP